MGEEKTGFPKVKDTIDLERGIPAFRIPFNYITSTMLTNSARTSLGLPTWIYGTHSYGEFKYGTNYWIYGTSEYGDFSYA